MSEPEPRYWVYSYENVVKLLEEMADWPDDENETMDRYIEATLAPNPGPSRAAVNAEKKVCGFCKGKPVGNAATWLDDKPRPPAPCPRCGETNYPEKKTQ